MRKFKKYCFAMTQNYVNCIVINKKIKHIDIFQNNWCSLTKELPHFYITESAMVIP